MGINIKNIWIDNVIKDYAKVSNDIISGNAGELWEKVDETVLFGKREGLKEEILNACKKLKTKDVLLLVVKTELKDDNIVNFQYLIALMERFDNIIVYLCSEDKNANIVYSQASLFLSNMLAENEEMYTRIIGSFYTKEKGLLFRKLSLKSKEKVHKKLSPIFKLDCRYFEKENYSRIPWNSNIIELESRSKKTDSGKWILEQCEELKKNIKREIITSAVFIEYRKYMTVFSYYLFCFIYNEKTSKKNCKLKEDDLIRDIYAINEIADGFLQLMENSILHTEKNHGFFCLRYHDLYANPNKKKYLESRYPQYGKHLKSKKIFIEMILLDLSYTGTIPSTFLANINNQIANGNSNNREKLIELKRDFPNIFGSSEKRITLKTFFSPNTEEEKFWERYNSIGDNVLYHYGIQIFDSAITNQNGIFRAVSSTNHYIEYSESTKEYYYNYDFDNIEDFDDMGHLPGSEFSVLIPIEYNNSEDDFIQKFSDVNANINYVNELLLDYQLVNITKVMQFDYNEIIKHDSIYNGQISYDVKKEIIGSLGEKLEKEVLPYFKGNKYNILYLNGDKITFSKIEYICKSLFYLILSKQNKKINILITECSTIKMLEIIRSFLIFFNKSGASFSFSNLQLYIRGKEAKDEFLIAGNNISQIKNQIQKLAFARCKNTRILQLLPLISDSGKGEVIRDGVSLAPFDLIELPDLEKTLFEKDVEETILSSIRDEEFGCQHTKTHVRVGSKIHLSNFYEAELLFHNTYYVLRFARLIGQAMISDLQISSNDEKENIILVGYEVYSEALMYEIVAYIKKVKDVNCRYIVYEQKNDSFINMDTYKLKETKPNRYVLIVPINSTLTTHNKLKMKLENELMEKDVEGKLDIAANYAVIILCDFIKNEKLLSKFWDLNSGRDVENILKSKRIRTSSKIKINPDIKYFVNIESKWKEPLECPYCFPKNSFLEEMPLIETNKESIVPMQKISLQNLKELEEQNIENIENDIYLNSNNMERLKAVKKHVRYKHSRHQQNHYLYYFKCNNYFLEEKRKIEKWLESLLKKIGSENGIVYNIIVAPLNSDNTGFIESFNNRIFNQQPAMVLKIDVDKEYRSNIEAKFSHLNILYKNIKKAGGNAQIRFHYVDVSINSGRTISRMKSILKTIFLQQKSNNSLGDSNYVLFYSITTLINRCSNGTKMNYIDDLEHFNSYLNINISLMRNHEDACILCKLIDDFERLSSFSVTDSIARRWEFLKKKHQCVDIHYFYDDNMGLNSNSGMRLETTHIATTFLNYFVGDEGYKRIQHQILKLMLGEKKDFFEYMISYIKVISRPFIAFEQNVKVAIFKIMLYIISYLIYEKNKYIYDAIEKSVNNEKIFALLKKVFSNLENITMSQKHDLLVTLINRLSAMGANYLIRKETFFKLLDYSTKELITKQKKENESREEKERREYYFKKLVLHYVFGIKRMITTSSDEIKALQLEKVLVSIKADEKYKDVREILYIENTRILKEAIKDLSKKCDCIGVINEIIGKNLETAIQKHDLKKQINQRFSSEEYIEGKEQISVVTQISNELNNYYYDSFKSIFRYNDRKEINELKIAYIISFYQEIIKYDQKADKLPNDDMSFKKHFDILIMLYEMITGAHKVGFYFHSYNNNGFSLNETDINSIINQDNDPINFQFEQGQFSIYRRYNNSDMINDKKFYERMITMFRYEIIQEITRDFKNGIIQMCIEKQQKIESFQIVSAFEHGPLSENITDVFGETKKELFNESIMQSYILQLSNRVMSTYYQKLVSGLRIKFEFGGGETEEYFKLLPIFEESGLEYKEKDIKTKINFKYSGDRSKLDEHVLVNLIETYHAELLLTLLIYNAAKHTKINENNQILVEYFIKDEYIVISNAWREFSSDMDVQKKIDKINTSIDLPFPSKARKSGITLWVLNKICKIYVNKKIKIDYKNKDSIAYFEVYIPLVRRKDNGKESESSDY